MQNERRNLDLTEAVPPGVTGVDQEWVRELRPDVRGAVDDPGCKLADAGLVEQAAGERTLGLDEVLDHGGPITAAGQAAAAAASPVHWDSVRRHFLEPLSRSQTDTLSEIAAALDAHRAPPA